VTGLPRTDSSEPGSARYVLYLASTSPRRHELLAAAGIPFLAVEPGPEDDRADDPRAAAERRARSKAEGARVEASWPKGFVLGADTVVDLDGRELGKPADAAAAREMLALLSGREHLVHTAHCLRPHPDGPAARREQVVTSRVRAVRLGAADVDAYIATGEWRDKAGGYGIQGAAGRLFTVVEGDFDTVVGLSLAALRRLLPTDHRRARPPRP
jgi:septum formation protein